MTRSPLPLVIEDVSAFAQTLRKHWPTEEPSHAQLLSLIAKSAGYRNHQHLKAEVQADPDLSKEAERRIHDALRVFDDTGQMLRWPKKTSVQALCMAWFWSRLPSKTDLSEPQVNDILRSAERFGDHVLLRRSLIEHKLVTRTLDGATYRRIEQSPSPEARQVIRVLSERVLRSQANPDNAGTRPAFGEAL
ncbi:hypothetical protein SAMN05444003_0475 [Cognatiyoonia sediminum]|uniref:DUF2087 domain-containing protein n=1 Tax=Cognatiyoonia sediminum TaxID=1508389 RepID=A0A1M5LVU1_9RHOB|nr:DUF2087 domain-containing protein [Cognatiyoonia sediminum]SHG68493.1 hypothetical protein SAMN05444003_0475 [Cognatiyoonia sediminum]